MIQNTKTDSLNTQVYIGFCAKGTLYDNTLIIPSAANNTIVYIDIETGLITFGDELYISALNPAQYSDAIYIGEHRILFVPRIQDKFLIFDCISHKQFSAEIGSDNIIYSKIVSSKQTVSVPESLSDLQEAGIYWEYLIYKNNLFLFPDCADHILKIDLNTMSVEKNKKIISDIDLLTAKNSTEYFGAKMQYDDNFVLLAGWSGNYIAKMNLNTSDYRITEIKNETGQKGFRDIVIYQDYIYAVNHQYHVLKYRRDTLKLLKEVHVLSKCSMVKKTERGICFVPAFEEDYVLCDSEENVLTRMPYPKECLFSSEKINSGNTLIAEDENFYFVAKAYGNTIEKIEKATGRVYYIPFKYDGSVIKHAYKHCKKCWEGESVPNLNGLSVRADLNDFIANICDKDAGCTERI